MKNNAVYRKLELEDCTGDLLNGFNRYQEVKRCYRRENGVWVLREIAFVEQWDKDEKLSKISRLSDNIAKGGSVHGAFAGDLIGFSSVGNTLFGETREYLQMELLHVSYEFRGQGIGKELFFRVCDDARARGAKKLYISAGSSEETQGFYSSIGCVDAMKIEEELYAKEPFDRHMEFCL